MSYPLLLIVALLAWLPAFADDHGHEEEHHEPNPQVGAGKGVTAADEHDGFRLSPEAAKNFEIVTVKAASNIVEIPLRAIVTAGTEVNVYRMRSGSFRRIDFAEISRTGEKVKIRSPELKANDEVAVQGIGFLRLTEIAAFGGAPTGHSH